MKFETICKRIGLFLCVAAVILTMFDFAVLADEEDQASADSEVYKEYVSETQKKIRMSKTLKYGMVPVYGVSVKDGTYDISAWSNSTYFKIEKAVLTAANGIMTAEITIPSMSYLKVFMGTSADAAAADKSELIGFEEVDGKTVFTIPVLALNAELDCAALSKARNKWYDRKLVFDASSLPEEALLIDLPDYDLIEDAIKAYKPGGEETSGTPQEETAEPEEEETSGDVLSDDYLLTGTPEAVTVDYPDGDYSIEMNMIGGSGRASISSPTWLTVKDGKAYAKLLWSSAYYDYMMIGDQKFTNLTTDGGNSTFEIPIVAMDSSFPVLADTTAMGDPVEIRYELTFYSQTIGSRDRIPQEAAKKVLIIAVIILVVGFVLNLVIKKVRMKGR